MDNIALDKKETMNLGTDDVYYDGKVEEEEKVIEDGEGEVEEGEEDDFVKGSQERGSQKK
eukprot:868663-Ditylum_brightwellii.AAC.1